MNIEKRKELRAMVRTMYDYQDMRLRTAGRLRLNSMDETVDEENMDDAEISEKDYDTVEYVKKATSHIEKRLAKEIECMIKNEPVYIEFFKNVRGCGPLMSAACLSEFDIHRADTVSKMWQFAGLNGNTVRGKQIVKITKKTDMTQIIREYENKNGEKCGIVLTDEMVRGDKKTAGFVAPYNSWLRTKLLGVLAGGMIKASIRWVDIPEDEYTESAFTRIKDGKFQKANALDKYTREYIEYKYRLSKEESKVMHCGMMTSWKDVTPGHRDHAAKRKMIKSFIQDLYDAWRKLEGLKVREPYQQEYLGHVHKIASGE